MKISMVAGEIRSPNWMKFPDTMRLNSACNPWDPVALPSSSRFFPIKKGVPYLDEAIQECKKYLATKRGVKDIEDDSRPGKREVMLSLNELGQNLGLDEAALSSTIRSGYFGAEVMRLQRGRHEVKLMVRYPYEDRKSMSGFEQIRIRDNQGVERPLIEVANIEVQQSASEINRLDQKRSVTVSADVDSTEGNSYEIISEMQRSMIPGLIEKFRAENKGEISFNWEGEQAQNQESITSMFTGFGIALLCMFVLLTLQFRSYVQPAIILAIIPFGWLGAIIGHYFVDINLSLFSFFGLIALTGVVVNDSIVLVDFINRKLRSGVKLEDALLSGRSPTVPTDHANLDDHHCRPNADSLGDLNASSGLDSNGD